MPGRDPAVTEHCDQVLRGQIWRLDPADVDLVQVGVLAVRHAAPGRALLMARERARASRALRVHAGVERVVADVEAPVLVEVVAPRTLTVPKLGIRQLAPVQVDVVETVLDPVARVVDAALDVGDHHVPAAQVPLRPGAGDVDAGGVARVVRVARPARQASVGMRLVRDGAPGRQAGVAGQSSVEVPLLVVRAARDRILGLALGEVGIVRVLRWREGRAPGRSSERDPSALRAQRRRAKAARLRPPGRWPSIHGAQTLNALSLRARLESNPPMPS